MNILEISTPDELHQAIGEFLQSDYSREDLIVIYEETRKCANRFRVTYSTLPKVPTFSNDPLDGLQEIGEWCDKSIKLVDDIVSDLNQQTINVTIRQLKKLKGSADSVLSLVDTKLKEQAQKEARAKVEKEYKKLDEEASKTKGMLLIQQAEVVMKIELEARAISRRETEDAIQIYLSKDPTFENRLSQLGEETNDVREKINKLVGDNTPAGKLLDVYCKLKNTPLNQQFERVGDAFSFQDLVDVIFGGCNRLYTSIDNVIKTFEEIQTKTKLKTDETHPQKKPTDSSETEQESLKQIIEALKNLQKSKKTEKDIKVAKSALPPIEETYEIICRSKGKCGAKTTNVIGWLGSAASDGSGYYRALLHALINPEVIADLETWQKKAATGQDTKREQEGTIEPKPPETLAKMLWLKQHGKKHWKLIFITILVILIPSLFVLPKIELFSKKPNVTANYNIFAEVSKDGDILRSNEFPWKIKKSKDKEGSILYTIVDRGGDPTAVSVIPDTPKYTVYESYDGMVIKYTCDEKRISDFTIKLKY